MVPRIVIDTNVLLSALQSRRGASFCLMSLVGKGRFEVVLSVPVVLEYEAAGKRIARRVGLRAADIDDVLDYLCGVSKRRRIHFLWRPLLRDPKDDMVLELAVEARCEYIVSHNLRHFKGCEKFGIEAIAPRDFLRRIGEIP